MWGRFHLCNVSNACVIQSFFCRKCLKQMSKVFFTFDIWLKILFLQVTRVILITTINKEALMRQLQDLFSFVFMKIESGTFTAGYIWFFVIFDSLISSFVTISQLLSKVRCIATWWGTRHPDLSTRPATCCHSPAASPSTVWMPWRSLEGWSSFLGNLSPIRTGAFRISSHAISSALPKQVRAVCKS